MKKNKLDKIFIPLYTSNKRYFFLTGGRGSTKTFSVHDFVLKLTYEVGHGILFSRYTMTSAEKSIIPEFKQTIERHGVSSDFHITKTTITNKKTGSFIFFSGIKTSSGDQTANLKSLPNITTWIIEEGEDFNDEKAFDTIDDSIRQKGIHNRIIWIMNPTVKEHFIYKRWVEGFEKQIELDGFNVLIGNHPEVENIHSSYLIATNYLSKSFLKKAWKWRTRAKTSYCPIEKRDLTQEEFEKAKKWYLNNYLGGWRDTAEGVIYEDWGLGAFNYNLPSCYGLDFGFDDPDALVRVAVDQRQKIIYLKEELYKNGLGSDTLAEVLQNICGNSGLIIADAAHKRLINDLYHKGLNIRRCKKGAGSVVRRIKTIQGYTIIVEPGSKNIIKALCNYVWHDKRSGVPRHEWSHIPDAVGYAAMDLIEYS